MTETEVQVYDFEGNDVRTMVLGEEPWFVGKDIAKALEYKNIPDALRTHVDKEDKKTLAYKAYRESRQANLWKGKDYSNKTIINESGMYSLIMGSKLDSAKRFKHWVTSEVLPSIRKHGAYMTPETIKKTLTDPDFIIGLATELKNEREARKQAELKNEQDKPLVQFAMDLATSDHSVLVGTFAKQLNQAGYKTGQNRLFEQLRKEHYLMSARGNDRYNLPTQQSLDQGLFEIKTSKHYNRDLDKIEFDYTTMVTPKGQMYFTKKLLHSN